MIQPNKTPNKQIKEKKKQLLLLNMKKIRKKNILKRVKKYGHIE